MMMVLNLNCGSWMVNSSRCVFISLAENRFCVYEFILQDLETIPLYFKLPQGTDAHKTLLIKIVNYLGCR